MDQKPTVKFYHTNDARNKDFYNLMKEGYTITKVYGDGVNSPLALEFLKKDGQRIVDAE